MPATMPISREWNPPSAMVSPLQIPVLLLLLAAISVFTIDSPLSRHATELGGTGEVHKALQSVEPFGNPYGMAVILLAILVAAPGRLMIVGRIATTGVTGGLAAGLVKLLVCRSRPNHFDFDHSILESFQGWLPLLSRGGSWQSFPSAHTATAVAFAAALAHQFPRAKWLCYALAALVGLQRIESGQHFASDVLVGAAVGWSIANLILAIWNEGTQTEDGPGCSATDVPLPTNAAG